jgi:hypothetical protein
MNMMPQDRAGTGRPSRLVPQQLVVRRKWLDEAASADVVALCQFLPGPASSHGPDFPHSDADDVCFQAVTAEC